ncbi:MAG: DUF2007 domain-containing protein [Planctomycetaceae bacterium]|nr:DUF2007 domain-containing protein [Planctomycetaceae bacterium]
MKRLYATTDPAEAAILRALLRDAGIESRLDNEGGADYAIGLPTSVAPLGIDVGDEDAPAAAEILAAHFEKQPLPGDDDPDAPAPLSPEETATFEAKVLRGRSKGRFWLAFFLLLPLAVTALSSALRGDGRLAAAAAALLVGIVALGAGFEFLVWPRLKRKKPAP